MKTSGNSSEPIPAPQHSVAPRKRFALRGRSNPFDPLTDAVRGDVADVRLADRFFAPHYAAPVTRSVTCEAALTGDRDGSNSVGAVASGETFEVLEFTSDAAWGIARPSGLVGYVALAALGDAA